METNKKYDQLFNYLKSLPNCGIAFSGGLDSSFLLAVAHHANAGKVIAFTVITPYIPAWEIQEAKDFTRSLGVKHILLQVPFPEIIRNNPADRCYLCKLSVFKEILDSCEKEGIKHLFDGTNFEDKNEHRPGMKALDELKVKSPLREFGFTKNEIREFSKNMNLPTWNKPPYACLLTRMPYDLEINVEDLHRVEEAEVFLFSMGMKAIRVRSHGKIARIEIDREERNKLYDEQLMDKISDKFKELGYQYITMELGGYKAGSMQ